MTTFFVFGVLVIASIVYTVVDDRRIGTERQMDDFYRVEYKKTYVPQNCRY